MNYCLEKFEIMYGTLLPVLRRGDKSPPSVCFRVVGAFSARARARPFSADAAAAPQTSDRQTARQVRERYSVSRAVHVFASVTRLQIVRAVRRSRASVRCSKIDQKPAKVCGVRCTIFPTLISSRPPPRNGIIGFYFYFQSKITCH